ncbi:hypothetical protein, partial [Devosia sp.]|uniref:hypothetical protein n=1 Tax=Devosia sp. TaxID=1871048 RepID=UPI002FC83201
MARAYPNPDMSDPAHEPQPGEWQALRGELVALLDQVEGRYSRIEPSEPELTGITRRVRNLRDQVVGPEPAVRRREALRMVKRAVDRFSERDEAALDDDHDPLSSAIAEIRGRQVSAPAAALGHRARDMPEFRQLSSLVSGLSGRLEHLEDELRSQRASNGSVNEVASQVEQLTHVVELLAGAVGETGQVKRLESQIGALAALIEEGSRVDLSAINQRLDDVSTTVGKLAELQAEQMEREISRDTNKSDGLAPAMHAIEKNVRNVYDRIDSIEKNVTLSSGDFERLTAEMAAFTQTMRDREAAPDKLMAKVDALASRIGGLDASNGDVVGLKQDIAALRDAVMAGMEPRFLRIESQIEALSGRMAPGDNAQVENQLKQLMQRMDETGTQLNGLAKLYSNQSDPADLEAMATLVAERTSDAVTRKAPAPVAMFGPDSLKSIEDRLTGLIKSAGKTPDYETLAAMVAERTSEAMAKSASPARAGGISDESMGALEKRMAALFNTAGKDTAERLTRLEAALAGRKDTAEPAILARPATTTAPSAPSEETSAEERTRFDAMLSALSGPRSSAKSDRMPANPVDDAPLIDPGFKHSGPVRAALDAKVGVHAKPPVAEPTTAARPVFDPGTAERPPPPQSSFAKTGPDPFVPSAQVAAPVVDAPLSQNGTSTFVAAARRAQRARQDASAPAAAGSNSLISRALARVMPGQSPMAPAGETAAAQSVSTSKPERSAKPVREKKASKAEAPAVAPVFGPDADAPAQQQSFLTRHRRPLLLAATLVAVSMLALNLVIQRMGPDSPQPAPAEAAVDATSDDVSFVRPEPRVIDMIDNTATGSINPGEAMSFTKPVATTPMPRTLLATSTAPAEAAPVDLPTETAPETTGSIPVAAAASA